MDVVKFGVVCSRLGFFAGMLPVTGITPHPDDTFRSQEHNELEDNVMKFSLAGANTAY